MGAALQGITSQKELATLLGISVKQLVYWSYIADSASKYHSFEIPKKSGGTRLITAPNDQLKLLMRRLKELLDELYEPKTLVHGFVDDKNIVSNADVHKDKRWVLNFDLENFFPSITFPRVRGLLLAKPYSLANPVATTIAQFCCASGMLPQGAPTSPVISNMICGRLDRDLKLFFRTNKCSYTRYADDITVSTSRIDFPSSVASVKTPPYASEAVLNDQLLLIIKNNGFSVNESKTRLQSKRQRQTVTGLTVNEFPNVRRQFVRETRALLHIWKRFGLGEAKGRYEASHPQPEPLSSQAFQRKVIGRLHYLSMVRGKHDSIYVNLARRLRDIDDTLIAKPIDATEIAEEAVWVIETDDRQDVDVNAMAQGTGVMLENIGLVTCDHVCAEPLVAFQPSRPSKRYAVEVIKRDENIDLAVLRIEKPDAFALKVNYSRPIAGAEVTILGFPAYSPGHHTIYRDKGTITQLITLHNVSSFLVSMPIIKGASGAPILDKRGQVIGIASRGADSHEKAADGDFDKYAVTRIDQVRTLK